MWLLGNGTPEQDIAEARAKEREGFHFFKLKIGVKPVADEIAATLAVREALGRKMPLCADANGGLTLADAKRYVARTRRAKLAFVEQPLPHDDLAGLKALAKLRLPIGVDESIHSLADVTANARAGAAGVSLKLIKLGGFTTAYEAAKLCRRLRLKINVAAKIAEFEHRHRGRRASRLRGAERRLGREPHAFLSRRRHRAASAADPRRRRFAAARPRPRRRG